MLYLSNSPKCETNDQYECRNNHGTILENLTNISEMKICNIEHTLLNIT